MRCDRRNEYGAKCARARGHIGACRSLADILAHANDRLIVDDPDAPVLPVGCIHVDALRTLTYAMMRLDAWHLAHDGVHRDRPCLRRLESANGVITAHISSGPAVGGTWTRLELVRGEWTVRDA